MNLVGDGLASPAKKTEKNPAPENIKFRMLAKRVNIQTEYFINEAVEYYYEQWGKFVQLPQMLNVVTCVVRAELERNANCELRDITGFTGETTVSREEYLQKLISEHLSLNQVRNLLKRKEES
jgi:uncharacterized membrane protein